MQASDFSGDAPGKLVRTADGHLAYVPHGLPSTMALDPDTIRDLSQADRSLGELTGVGRMLPNPHLLIGPFLRREAVLSSRIEGTQTTTQELLLFEAGEAEVPGGDAREVLNYVRALEYGLKRLKSLPVCLRLITEIHSRLMTGVRGEDRRPGEFRTVQNMIGRQGQPVERARFVPPPVAHMKDALIDLERYIHAQDATPPLVQLALIHYQFETIHPFVDGNGRVGRLLIPLLLCERKHLAQPLLYLSGYFEAHRQAYYDHLLQVSQTGAWQPWIRFFLAAVEAQSKDAIDRAGKLLNLLNAYRDRLQRARSSALAVKLVETLFRHPAITIPRAKQVLKVTYRSAQLNIEKLVGAGILEEVTGRQRNRVYLASDLVRLVETK